MDTAPTASGCEAPTVIPSSRTPQKNPSLVDRDSLRNQAPQGHSQAPQGHRQAPQDRNQAAQDRNQAPQGHGQARNQAPQARNQAPQTRNQTPQARNQAPQARNQAPQARNQAPQSRNQSLRGHNQTPQARNQALQGHNQAPQDHNQAPQYHNQTLQGHDQAPQDRNQSLRSHNQAPQGRNQAIQDHNQAPQDHNQAPQDHNQTPQDRNQDVQDLNLRLQDSILRLQDSYLRLQDDNRALKDDNRAFRDGNRTLQDSNRTLETTVDKLTQARDSLEEECKQHQKNAEALRTIILKEGLTEKIDERDLIRSFMSLRRQVQSFTANSLPNIEQPHIPPPDQRSKNLRRFLGRWEQWRERGLKQHELVNRLRCEVFTILWAEVFSRPLFGIGMPWGSQQRDVDLHAESFLQRLEKHMYATNVNPTIIAEWRIATLSSIEAMHLEEVISADVAEEIIARISPFAEPLEMESAIRPAVNKMSKDAVLLVLRMRRSRDRYAVERVEIGTKFDDCREFAEDQDTEGGELEGGVEKVAYTLFGALTKYTEAAPTTQIILEKAQVVVETS